MPALDLQEIVTTADMEALAREWFALWDEAPGGTSFQTPAWLIPWWRHLGEGQLRLLAFRRGGRLVGVAPFYLHGHASRRRLFPLGIGTTDYLDALFAPGEERACLEGLRCWLDASAGYACEWPQLPPDSPLLRLQPPPGWTMETGPADPCPALHFRSGGGAPEARSEPMLRLERLQDDLRRAARRGPVRFESACPANLEALWEALCRLHAARWAARGGAGVLADPRVAGMHREALPRLLHAGLLRLYALRIGDRIVAAYYGLMDTRPHRRRACYYLGGFDPEFREVSPGHLVVGHAIREALREGAAAFDFLRGQETYKYRWGATDTPTYVRRLQPARADTEPEAGNEPPTDRHPLDHR